MNWTFISTGLSNGSTVGWNEFEPGSERAVRFEVGVSKWSQVVGRAYVKVWLPRVKRPEGDVGPVPARYLGCGTFDLRDGRAGYHLARVAALREAYQTRQACEREVADEA